MIPSPRLPSPLLAGIIEPVSVEMDEESEEELEGLAMAMGGQHHSDPPPAAAAGGGSGSGAPLAPLGPLDDLQAQRFALLRDLWATAG